MISYSVTVAVGSVNAILQRTSGDEDCAMPTARSHRILCLAAALVVVCFVLSGCPEFESIEYPSSVSPGGIFTVSIKVLATANEDEAAVLPYFGIRLPEGWTIPGDAITCRGVYEGVITYDPHLALEQEALSPSPEGYYWWVGSGEEAYVVGSVYGEIQIQTSTQLGLYSFDCMSGNSYHGLNLHRSDNHVIHVVDERTPRGLRAVFQGDAVLLSWVMPHISDQIVGYNIYRDGQLIGTIPFENTEYTDEDLPSGVFYYSVSAVYEDGQEHLTPYEVKGLVFSGGTGAPNDPFQIASAEQLVCIADFPTLADENLVLINNINLDPNQMEEADFERSVIPRFSGTLDGNGFVISNLTLTGCDHLGLIGTIEEGGLVQNLSVVDANIAGGGDWIGIIAGTNRGTVSNSSATGAASGRDSVGGLAGDNDGTITSSYSTGAVTADGSHIGGLVGYNGIGSITSCYSTGSVTGDESIGGLVGYNNEGGITSCYSTGSVTGESDVAGLVGWNRFGSITSCYSVGSVTGESGVGGLVGVNAGGLATSFWDTETSGQATSAGGTGRTTAEMQTASTFLNAGWDFVGKRADGTCDFWVMPEGSYPSLAVFSDQRPTEPLGSGTLEAPYVLTDANDLGTIWYRPGAHYRLASDIDLSRITWNTAATPGFAGCFDGNGYAIYHLQIAGGGHLGLFGICASGATVSHVGLEAADVNGTNWHVGGLVGINAGAITMCYSTGSVTGRDYYVGGLVGQNRGAIASSYSTVAVTGFCLVGGLVGWNYRGDIMSCYSTGSVTGESGVAGLVGDNRGSIANSYSTGAVTSEQVFGSGGLVETNGGSITSCFWDIEASGVSRSDGGTGLTTAEMQTVVTFIEAGWGSDLVWVLDEGRDYPRLWWEGAAGESMMYSRLYVDDDAPNDPGPGDPLVSDPLENGSEAHPFDTIQEAIDIVPDCLPIVVQPGQYLTSDPWARESISFLGKNIVLSSTEPTNPEIVRETVIRGAVLFSGTEDPSCTLAGFRIHSPGYGGISGNHTRATISHCIISGNGPCGGTVMKDCDGTISNCLIADNTTFFSCGTFPVLFGCNGLIKNCTIANNISGIAVATARIENCIIYNNDGFQVGIGAGVTASISYSNIQGGRNGIAGEGVADWGLGNIDVDPGFVRLGYWVNESVDVIEGDYHLRSEGWRWDRENQSWTHDHMTSPCVDAGNPDNPLGEELMTVPGDPDNEYGVNVRINMGAYGGTVQASMPPLGWTLPSDLDNDGAVDSLDLSE